MNASVVRLSRVLCRVAALVAGSVGASGLAGGALDVEVFKAGFAAGGLTIKANAAACLLLLGGGLLLLAPERPRWRWQRAAGRAAAAVAMAAGGLTLTQHVTGADLGIDQVLFHEPPGAAATAAPGRMGPPASLSFLLSGLALLLLEVRTRRRGSVPAQWLALLVGLIALLPIIGYSYGAQPLYGVARYTGIALHTAVAILALAVGLFVARPTVGPASILCADDAGGAMARRLLLPAILIPFALGFLETAGEGSGLLDAALGQSLLVLSLIASFTAVVYWNARALSALGRARQRATARVERLYAVAAALSEARSTADVARVAVEQGIRALGAGAGSLSLLSEDGSALEMAGSVGYPPGAMDRWRRFPLDAPIPLTDAVRRAEPVYLKDPEERLRRYPALSAVRATRETRSSACVPLLMGGRAVGVLGLSFDRAGAVAEEDREFIEALARQCAQALERARLFEAERRAREAAERARAAAERASEAKSEFLSILSHELRTPLTPVLLTASLMEARTDLPADLRADVASIRRNVELESRLISDLLDLTRIERGKLHLEAREVDLHVAVRSAIDICQREASARLAVDLAARRHAVRGDATRLQQVFWNLVNNAQKFTPPEGTITVRTSDAAGDGVGRVRVEVSDTGAGIAPEVLPRLFTAFEQGEVRAERQQAGLGLGLAISKRLVEAHGGTIVAASAGKGRGATFTVELPALEPSASRPDEGPGDERPRGAGRPLRVLLVEDHEPTLGILTRLLRGLGHQVTGTATAASALASAQRDGGFDLIISDLGLPDGSGLDVMRRLRGRYAGRAIALTGYGMDSDVAASREAGFALHLTKPVDVAALEAAIERVASDGGAGAAGAEAAGSAARTS